MGAARVPVYILAGGRSSRFGSDKARAVVDGKPLILHVADAVREFASSITAVADVPDKYRDLGLRTIGDRRPGLGPLGGLAAALGEGADPWLVLAPCDFVGLRSQWVGALVNARGLGVAAAAFRGERWQTLPGLYHVSLNPVVRRLLRGTDHSLQGLLDQCRALSLPLPRDWPDHPGINTPEELERWRGRAADAKIHRQTRRSE